jgi:hypothetical protein
MSPGSGFITQADSKPLNPEAPFGYIDPELNSMIS